MIISGNVGIGTTSLGSYKLRVKQTVDTIDYGIMLEGTTGAGDLSIWVNPLGGAGMYTRTNTPLFFGTNGGYNSMSINTVGNVLIGNGANIIYRCTTAGALPVGALTINSANCGASADTKLRVP
jgi:hypothetical protein